MTFDFPAPVKAYFDRVSAKPVNYRRALITRDVGHYYVEKAVIRIEPDGTVTCNKSEFAPTKDEAAAMKTALAGVAFPRSVLAVTVDDLRPKLSGQFWEFYDRRNSNHIIMVQERVMLPTGEKRYLPWTQFSNGEWLQQEPDGKLPFWKPKEGRGPGARIMIHEGAKAASFADRVVREKIDHPWREELERYEHWGMIGGAMAPGRTDYDELNREKPTEVVYVCDNDWAGKNAAIDVSRLYGHSMKAIKFENPFPEHFDVADPIPDELFTKRGRYIGPSLMSLAWPATCATTVVAVGPKGGITWGINHDFATEWVHCVTPNVFIHKDAPWQHFDAGSFNNFVQPFSAVNDTAQLLKRDFAGKGVTLTYEPGMPPGLFADGGEHFINTHVPSDLMPEEGDPAPFLEYMQHLIPNDGDRHETLRWLATLIGRPDIRMRYGLLLVSENQGVGKGTLGERILPPILGRRNVSTPSEAQVVDSSFNGWLGRKRLAVMHEIYAGGTPKAYNKLKSIITEDVIRLDEKYERPYDLRNQIHVLACSNSYRALKIETDDRRWLVPKVTEEKRSDQYWIDFNEWLVEGGLAIIRWWATDFLTRYAPVSTGASAPDTSTKSEVVKEGYSAGQALALQTLETIKEKVDNGDLSNDLIVLDQDVVDLIRNRMHGGNHERTLERPGTVRKVAKTLGWHIGPKRIAVSLWGPARRNAYVMSLRRDIAETDAVTLSAAGCRPLDLSQVEGF